MKRDIDWNDPAQKRAYNREWMRAKRASDPQRCRIRRPVAPPSLALFPGIYIGTTYRAIARKILGEIRLGM